MKVKAGKFSPHKAVARAHAMHKAGKISAARRDALIARAQPQIGSPPSVGAMPPPDNNPAPMGGAGMGAGGPDDQDAD